ncbi:MAG: hypothetical protein E5X55_33025 [Mesorhizobium sp.]|nr:MAG: hypothetical protein E5X55_33025 [Mesorhizobium sp.]
MSSGQPSWSIRLADVRCFAQHLIHIDPLTEVPPLSSPVISACCAMPALCMAGFSNRSHFSHAFQAHFPAQTAPPRQKSGLAVHWQPNHLLLLTFHLAILELNRTGTAGDQCMSTMVENR